MKSYKQLLSFGCSYTEGGGLNSPHYHAFLTNTKTDSISPTPYTENYANFHSFPGYLSRLLNCSFVNYGISCAANELIFETVFDVCGSIEYNIAKNTLVTIQTSSLSRMYLHDNLTDKAYTLNSPDARFTGIMTDNIHEYYLQYVTHFFNQSFEHKKVVRNVKTLRTWLKSKGFDVILLSAEYVNNVEPPFFYFPNSNDGTLVNFMHVNKLAIADIPNTTFIDYHMTEKGNEIVANLLFNNLQELIEYD